MQNGAAPATQNIAMTITGSNVAAAGAAYVGGATQPAWLGINMTGAGTSYSVVLSISQTNLAPGQYTSTFSVGTANSNGAILSSQAITVTYTVSSPPPPDPNAGTFTLGATSASFTALQNGASPANQAVAMTITGPGASSVGIGYGTAQPSWLSASTTGSGTSYNVVLSITQVNLAPGQYTGTVLVRTIDSNGVTLKTQTVTVTYTVIARVSMATPLYTQTYIYGDTRTGETVALPVVAGSRSWTAASSAAWLQVPSSTQTGSGTLNAVVDINALAPGQYTGTVTVTSSLSAQDTASVSFTVTVQSPALTVNQGAILVGGQDGRSSAPQTLSFSLNTGSATYPFTLSARTDSGGNWLNTSVPSGNVGNGGASVQISAVRGSLPGATYTGELTLTVTVRSLVFTEIVPVTYNIEANRIVLGASGAGFSSSPSPARSVLTRKVKVFSSIASTNTPWAATADQSWLTVTASGVTGGALTLTADPTGLTQDQTHFATVTVTSSDPHVDNQPTIRVGLHINSAAPADTSVSVTAQNLVASPVEPFAFVTNGGTQISVYNVYTSALVNTLTTVVADAGAMAMSGDGRYLFVYDRTNIRVTQLNASTGTLVRHYSSTINGGMPYGGGLAYIRPAAYPVIITPGGRLYDTDTGTEYSGTFVAAQFAFSLQSSEDNSRVTTDGGGVFRLTRSALSGGSLSSSFDFSASTAQGRAGQACISEDAQFLYTASGAPYNFPGTDMVTHQIARTLPGTNYPNSMLCLWNGVIVGGVDGYYANADVFIYDGPTGQQLATVSSSSSVSAYRSLRDRGMAASADAARLITLSGASPGSSNAPEVRFQALPGAL